MMSPALHQSLTTLVRERITYLENTRFEFRAGIKYWFERARGETPEGREAYGELNRCKNGLRSTNKKLRKWRQVQVSLNACVQNPEENWVLIQSESARNYLYSLVVTPGFSDGGGI